MTSPRESSPSHVVYDDSDWPIFRVQIPERALTSTEFRAHVARLSAAAERGEPYGLLIDALKAPPLNASERQLIADSLRFTARRHPGILRGVAVCLESAISRGGLTAITWLARPPYPMKGFESVASANVWLARQLAVPTSPHIGAGV